VPLRKVPLLPRRSYLYSVFPRGGGTVLAAIMKYDIADRLCFRLISAGILPKLTASIVAL